MNPARTMTIDGWIADGAARHPDKPALIFEGDTLNYSDFLDEITTCAGGLVERGVDRGDRVAWYGLNHSEVFILLFACARIGAILTPLNWRLSKGEIAEVVASCAPKLTVHDAHYASAAASLGIPNYLAGALRGKNAEANGAETDPILLVYTSGSTGRPKGVVLTQTALIANAQMSVEAHGLKSDDKVLNVLPLFHVGGLNILPTPTFSIGGTVVLHERFVPEHMAAELPKVAHAITVPTVLQAVLKSGIWAGDIGALRTLSIGSTDVPLELFQAVHERGIPLLQIYGATETCPLAIYQIAKNAFDSVGSIGRAGSRCQIRLMQEGVEVGTGDPGEIWINGENTLREYWRDPDESAKAIQNGWFRTGDVATCDEDGFYWFTDRIKHVIISGGENIYPAEIERILRQVPGVVEVSVVGRADPKWGEVPVAVVSGSVDKGKLLESLEGRLARFKHPKDVVIVDALPRNAMGKIVAEEVRKLI